MKKTAVLQYHTDELFPHDSFGVTLKEGEDANEVGARIHEHLANWRGDKGPEITCMVEELGRMYRFSIEWHRQVDIFTRTQLVFMGKSIAIVYILPDLFRDYQLMVENTTPQGMKALLKENGFKVVEQYRK